MDYHQRNKNSNDSILTVSQPLSSLPSTSSILDSTNSFIMINQSNIDIHESMIRNQLLRKQYNQQMKNNGTSSQSMTTNSSISQSTITIMKKSQYRKEKSFSKNVKQEARPLGTCVRRCNQCQQLKHILLVECSICFRMIDIDLKDCKCQIVIDKNIIERFHCSICNHQLTLNGYIICANRICQTVLAGLINKEINIYIQEKVMLSAILTDICYPRSIYRTVAVQVDTLNNLPSLQHILPTIIDDKNENLLSLSLSKHDLNSMSTNVSDSSTDMNTQTTSYDDRRKKMITAFNSNQPTKLTLQSDDNLRQEYSEVRLSIFFFFSLMRI